MNLAQVTALAELEDTDTVTDEELDAAYSIGYKHGRDYGINCCFVPEAEPEPDFRTEAEHRLYCQGFDNGFEYVKRTES